VRCSERNKRRTVLQRLESDRKRTGGQRGERGRMDKGKRIEGFQTEGTDVGRWLVRLRNTGDSFKLAEYQGSGFPAPPNLHPQIINESQELFSLLRDIQLASPRTLEQTTLCFCLSAESSFESHCPTRLKMGQLPFMANNGCLTSKILASDSFGGSPTLAG
jgi:hypothetical protein